jgi:hypothetical protein
VLGWEHNARDPGEKTGWEYRLRGSREVQAWGPQELISVAFPSFYVSAFLPNIKFTRQDLLHEN